MWIKIAVQTVECATAKRNESNYNLDFGYYEQTEMFHLLWKAVTVPTVECTTAICKTKLIKLPFGCYEQTELCPLLWVDVTGPFIVRFVPDGKFTLPPNTLYFSFIYCHSCRSWYANLLDILKVSGASPPNNMYFLLLSDSLLEANLLEISKTFGGFVPKYSIYLPLSSDSFLGDDFLNISNFSGTSFLRVCTSLYCQIRS